MPHLAECHADVCDAQRDVAEDHKEHNRFVTFPTDGIDTRQRASNFLRGQCALPSLSTTGQDRTARITFGTGVFGSVTRLLCVCLLRTHSQLLAEIRPFLPVSRKLRVNSRVSKIYLPASLRDANRGFSVSDTTCATPNLGSNADEAFMTVGERGNRGGHTHKAITTTLDRAHNRD